MNPADMSFDTLKNYYYDNGAPNQPNWVFPLQLSRATRRDKKPDKNWMDSRTKK